MSRSKSALDVTVYRLRRLRRQARRLAGWWTTPARWPRAERYDPLRHGSLESLVQSHTAPLDRADAWADPALEAGKRHNLALAAPAFDGLWLSPDRPLSFWRTLGPATEARGYTWGVELRGGCVTPAIAGGLCLLSNGLFDLAAHAGWRIVERHGHSMEAIPPARGQRTLDATVAWPDVDLVIAPREGPVRLSVMVGTDALSIRAYAARPSRDRWELEHTDQIVERGGEHFRQSCAHRRRIDEDGREVEVDVVAQGERRLLKHHEVGRSCLTCGELECRDRPNETVLTQLRSHRS